jgi:hypothetical protein
MKGANQTTSTAGSSASSADCGDYVNASYLGVGPMTVRCLLLGDLYAALRKCCTKHDVKGCSSSVHNYVNTQRPSPPLARKQAIASATTTQSSLHVCAGASTASACLVTLLQAIISVQCMHGWMYMQPHYLNCIWHG